MNFLTERLKVVLTVVMIKVPLVKSVSTAPQACQAMWPVNKQLLL